MQLSWISSVTNRYSVGIYIPKGVGEGKRPDLVGAQGGIGMVRVPRNLDPQVNTHCLVGEISRVWM
jgi:hypothetical protein